MRSTTPASSMVMTLVLALLAPVLAAEPALPRGVEPTTERMSPELLWRLGRVGGGALSPDGASVAFTVRRYDLAENKGRSEVWVVAIARRAARKILDLDAAGDVQWATTQQGARLFLIGTRDDVKGQVFSCRLDGTDLRQVTSIDGGVANLRVSPTGEHIAFTRDVKLDLTVNELYEDLPKADARIIDSLFYRHWDAWHDYAYSHLCVAPLVAGGKAGDVTDLMEGLRADCPLPPFGGNGHYAWSPDGRELAYTAKLVNNPAESTDSGIFLVPIDADDDGGRRTRCITTGRKGYDTDPRYSPDGRFISFLSMERAGFESDRNRILLFDRARGTVEEITVGLDRTAHAPTWAPDSTAVYFTSEDRGTTQVFRVTLGRQGADRVTSGRYNFSLRDIAADGGTLVAARMSMLRPYELVTVSTATGGEGEPLTRVNDRIYGTLDLPRIEERWVRASDGASIHCWVIFPPGFDRSKRWPMLTYCQGGPQGQIGQWFSFRWNFHLMAAQDYVVLAVNRRGLPGFGREWNDQISGDWGGQAMQDILSAHDDMLTERYVDPQRVAAIGASFGGYTVYWLMGNAEQRFAAMVAHCGVFNLESKYGSTEELFFPNWDLGGPYWRSERAQRDYDRFSPHRFVRNWKTPLLVIHGEKDFRVPVTQGMEAFTAAQIEGVPSRFLYYPNEGHWVLSPQNGVLWHRVFFDWLGRYCK